jgi:hypothetical protein
VEYVLWLILTLAGGEQHILEIRSFADPRVCTIAMKELNLRIFNEEVGDHLQAKCLKRGTT